MTRAARALALCVSLLLLGCFEEQLTVSVTPDGQGTLQVERTLSESLTRQLEDDERATAHLLAEWQGVAAWTDVSSELQGGRLRVRATGWFTDVSALRRRAPRDGLSFTLRRTPGQIQLGVREDLGLEANALLDSGDPVPQRALRASALRGFTRRIELVLPNELTGTQSAQRVDGARVRALVVREGEAVASAADDLGEQLEALRARFSTGDLTRAAAARTFTEAVAKATEHSARCDVKPGAGASTAFRVRLLDAVARWSVDPWSSQVRAQRRVLALPTGDAPLDRFEPNASDEQAAALKAGLHTELTCDGDDWYRIEVHADTRLRVTLIDPADVVDLELHGPDDAEARPHLGAGLAPPHVGAGLAPAPAERSATLLVLGKKATVHTRVHGAFADYRLRVAFEPAPRADAFEPNDTRAAAKQLPPGEHPALRCDGEDWYALDVPAGHRARLRIEPGGPDLDLALHTPDGLLLRTAEGLSPEELLELPAGETFLRVHGGSATYDLRIEPTPQ